MCDRKGIPTYYHEDEEYSVPDMLGCASQGLGRVTSVKPADLCDARAVRHHLQHNQGIHVVCNSPCFSDIKNFGMSAYGLI